MNFEVYDVILITFQNLIGDARTLNFAQTFTKFNKKILVISLESDIKIDRNFMQIEINAVGNRAFSKMLDFHKKIKKLSSTIKAKSIIAGDFFSLKAGIYISNKETKLIYDSREIYSEIASLSDSYFRQMIQTFLEKRWIKKYNEIIVTGELDKEYLTNHFKKKKNYYIIKNLPFYKEPTKSNYLRDKFNIKQKNILIYQGMLQKGRGIEKLLKVIKLLPDSALCLVGEGELLEVIRNYIIKNNLENQVFLTGLVKYEDLHNITSSADLGLSLIEPISISYQMALPNKIFEYAMAGIPVLCSDLPQMKSIIDKYNIGIYINYDTDIEYLARTINSILSVKEDYVNNALIASKELCWESQEQIIMNLI